MLVQNTGHFAHQNRAFGKSTADAYDDHQTAYDHGLPVSNFNLTNLAKRPAELMKFVRCHSARVRRQTMSKQNTIVECNNIFGTAAVDISFGRQT